MGQFADAGQQERRNFLAAHPAGLRLLQGLNNGFFRDRRGEFMLRRNRRGDQGAGGEAEGLARADDVRHFVAGVAADVQRQAGIPGIEGGEVRAEIADDRHAVGFQHLQRQGEIQDGLGAGANHGHGRLGQFHQIRADIEGMAAVHAADAAGGEHPDARQMGHDHGAGHGGGAIAAPGQHDGEIPPAALADIAGAGQVGQLIRRQTHGDAALQHGDGGGHGAGIPHGFFHGTGHFLVHGIRQAVRDQRAFKRDDRAIVLQRFPNFRMKLQ